MAGPSAHDLLDKALKRQKELLTELEALTEFVETYRRVIGPQNSSVAPTGQQPSLFEPPSRRAAHAEKITEMIDVARRIIIAENRPMKRGDLRRRVEELGFQVVGADKNKVFGTNLWRSKKFILIDRHGYWPIDAELPAEYR